MARFYTCTHYVELQVTFYPHMEKKEDHAVKESIGAADTSLRITSALLVPSYIILGLSDQLICWCTPVQGQN